MEAWRYVENLFHPPFVGSAASVAVAALQISLTERFWSPDVQGESWRRGRTAACPACSSSCSVVPGGPGWDQGSHCALLSAKLQPDEIPVQRAD